MGWKQLIEPPASVTPGQRRGYFVIFFGNLVGLVNHIAFLAIFATWKVAALAWFNVFSVALFAFNLLIQKRSGRTLTAMVLAALEVTLHQVVAVVILGWDFGFQYYLIVVPAFIFMGHFERRAVPLGIASIAMGALAWLGVAGRTIAVPHAVMPEDVRVALYALNLMSTAVLVAVFAFIYHHEARDRERALVNANDVAERASMVKSEFLANMSHELRTPLNAIIGYSEMLSEEAEDRDDPALGDLVKITTAGRHLLELVNDILDLSKIEAGRLELADDLVDIQALVVDLETMFRPMVSGKPVELRIDVDEAIPSALTGDPLRLRQVLVNLVSNAVKFTAEGEVAIHARLNELHDDSAAVRISVRDTGIGIAADRIDELFEPFIQADGSVQREYGGTGLGLSISRQLVEMMGGELIAESEPGKGTCFTAALTLPRRNS